MKWIGRTTRNWGEDESRTDNRDVVPVLAIIELKDNIQYEYHVYDILQNGKLGEDKVYYEWVSTLSWAKRKCKQLVEPLRASDWLWERTE